MAAYVEQDGIGARRLVGGLDRFAQGAMDVAAQVVERIVSAGVDSEGGTGLVGGEQRATAAGRLVIGVSAIDDCVIEAAGREGG